MYLYSDRKIMGGSCQRLHSSSNCLKNNHRGPVRCPPIRLLGNCLSCTWAHDNYWAEANFFLLCNRANSIFYLHYQWNMTKLCRPRLVRNLKTIFLICLFSESVVSNVFNLKLLCNVLKLYNFYGVHFPPITSYKCENFFKYVKIPRTDRWDQSSTVHLLLL